MNGFEKQELETQGMMSRLFGSKPGHNAEVWKLKDVKVKMNF